MNETVDFYFDFMSPYSCLAATRVEATLEPLGASINWRACFLPGLLKAAGNRGPGEIPAKALYAFKDLNDWAEHLGLPPIVLPDRFPFFATQANRCALIAQQRGAASTFCASQFTSVSSATTGAIRRAAVVSSVDALFARGE